MSGAILSTELAKQVKALVRKMQTNNISRPNSTKKRRHPRTAGTSSGAKFVSIDMTKPAYETKSGATVTAYLPAGTGTVLSRDTGTGEMSSTANTVNLVNASPRVYDPATSRGRTCVAVPLESGGYVPIPLATDPFVPAVHAAWTADAAQELALSGTEFATTSADLDDGSGDWTLTAGIGVSLPADADEYFPPYARPQNDRLYLLYPGLYLIHFSTDVYWVERSSATAKTYTLTTTSAGGTPHTHDVDVSFRPRALLRTSIERGSTGSSFDLITRNIAQASFFSPQYSGSGSSYMGAYHGSCVVRVLESTSVSDRYIYPKLTMWGCEYDTATPPSFRFSAYVTAIPLTCDNYLDDTDTDAEWKHNPWEDSTYKWWGTGTEPT